MKSYKGQNTLCQQDNSPSPFLFLSAVSSGFVFLFSSFSNTLPSSLSLSLLLVPALYPWPGNKNNLSCGDLGDKDRRSWRVLGEPVAKRRSTMLLRGVCYHGGSTLLGGCPVYLQLLLPVGVRSNAWGWLVCNGRCAPKEKNKGTLKLTATPIGHQ